MSYRDMYDALRGCNVAWATRVLADKGVNVDTAPITAIEDELSALISNKVSSDDLLADFDEDDEREAELWSAICAVAARLALEVAA